MVTGWDLTGKNLKQRAIESANRLIDNGVDGQTTGEAVARDILIDLNERSEVVQLYHAFKAADEEGSLRCTFPGGMELPVRIRR
jgi:hypothetical protein